MHLSEDLEVETRWLRKGYYLTGENYEGVLPDRNTLIQRRGWNEKKRR